LAIEKKKKNKSTTINLTVNQSIEIFI
jgi:hypothetical protein